MVEPLIRPLLSTDSMDALTALIRAAYARHAALGLRYWATHQSVEDTARRFASGQGFIALAGEAYVGTIVVRPPQPASPVLLYREPYTWSFSQFAVAPEHQGRGVGKALHDTALQYALSNGGRTMALDTAAPAEALIAMYERWGYRRVGTHDWRPHTNYESVLMARPVTLHSSMPGFSPVRQVVSPEILGYYERGREAQRLASGGGQLELARTQELLRRYLPEPPAVLLDVGGGPGTYACWLATAGYEVHLVDPVPLHLEQAEAASRSLTGQGLASISLGDARRLERPDDSVDAVLLLGPLYHLTERSDRVAALREARRVLKPGGRAFAVGISRFASSLDGIFRGYLADPAFVPIVEQDLADGQHRNPDQRPGYFTTAFFHRPDELKEELEEAALRCEALLAIEGPGWLLRDLDDTWAEVEPRERLLAVIRALETESYILGVSAHLLAVGRKSR